MRKRFPPSWKEIESRAVERRVIKVAMGGAGAPVQGVEVPVGPGVGSQLQPGLCEKTEHTDTAIGL